MKATINDLVPRLRLTGMQPKERSTALTDEQLDSLRELCAWCELRDVTDEVYRARARLVLDAALSHRSRPETDALSSDRASAKSLEAADGDRA